MYVGDLGIIFTIDWALDRCAATERLKSALHLFCPPFLADKSQCDDARRVRTTVNVLGDCLGAGIMQHLCGDGLRDAAGEYDDISAGDQSRGNSEV
jgi:hypothetical protein